MAIDYPEQHRREALIGTIVLHVLLVLLFFFAKFNGPNPPLETFETGGGGDVELNYGLDSEGSGDVQTTAAASASDNRADSKPPALSPDPQPTTTAEQADPTPPSEAQTITSDAEESPVSAPVVESPAPPKEEVKVTKPKRQVAVAFSPNGSNNGGGTGTNGTSTAPTGNNNGDRPGKVGDQGDPKGSLDAKALYGAGNGTGGGDGGGNGRGRGAGDGDGLSIAGWAFDKVPDIPKIDDNSGIARFKIVIDEEGNVESVTKVSGSISPQQSEAVRNALMKASFRPTNANNGGATGFYVFRYSVQ